MLDLGIKGRKAIVCAASKGLGRACAMALGRAGVDLVITARTKETLEQTAEEIRKETGAKVTAVPGDISTEAGRVGDPKEFGDACAFLCAASSGFIVGQNLLLDGGAFNSTMG
jgi:NAD(P)-dependent dehydrogenase (short-subunit alcohol dehydrogenase family)